MQNGYVESFNGKMQDELLNVEGAPRQRVVLQTQRDPRSSRRMDRGLQCRQAAIIACQIDARRRRREFRRNWSIDYAHARLRRPTCCPTRPDRPTIGYHIRRCWVKFGGMSCGYRSCQIERICRYENMHYSHRNAQNWLNINTKKP